MAMDAPAPQVAEPASEVLGRRIGAALVDFLVLVPLFVLLALVIGDTETDDGGFQLKLRDGEFLVFFGLSLLYYFALEAHSGQTVGKRLLGIRVVAADGGKASVGQIAVRTLLRVIDVLPAFYLVGFISALATRERSARLGDLAAGTRVARLKKGGGPSAPGGTRTHNSRLKRPLR